MDSGHVDPGCPSAAAGGEPSGPAGEPSACRAREVLQRVGDKWSMYVIDLLGHGTMRFSEL
ncbi:MAG: winged helix-turn-helix transcriptional regulator, partial [Streptosporangiaceae bacterium]